MNQNTKNISFFIIPALIWGSTWFVIKFQLGTVDPILSVSYRFLLSGLILMLGAKIMKLNMRFSPKQHFFMLLQGVCLFGLNYWLVYMAEEHLTSGLVSVIFTLVLFSNAVFSQIILKIPIRWSILAGAILGLGGTALIFLNEIMSIGGEHYFYISIALVFGAVVLASLGNVIAGLNQKRGLPVIQLNAYGMVYGALMLFIVALFKGTELSFDLNAKYTLSLLYLTVFGSVIAFSTYLKLLGNIGPSKSAYVVVLVPIIAMTISTVFESYVWQKTALIGLPLLIAGNLIALGMLKPQKIFKRWK